MLNFIFGRPGSGKTQYMIDKIRESVAEGITTYLLVPEQQAFISESMLADLPPSSGLYFSVISFSRLANIVFEKCGGLTDAAASGGIRNLVMWQALREVSSLLLEYGNVKADASFGSMMLSTVDELHANRISPEDCESAAEECSDELLGRKLADVALIYANFSRVLSERVGEGALAAENRLAILRDTLSKKKIFESCRFFVDSFTSFTGEEHAVLEELALQSDQLSISFCRDGEMKNMPHTASVDDTYRRFRRFAKENEIEISTITLSPDGRGKNADIVALEKGLWDFSLIRAAEEDEAITAPDGIEAYVCKNEFDEVNLAALKILQAYRSGTKFSEMALIVRDAETRKGLIEAVFEKAGIPFFISERTDLSSSAAARLIFSALRCVTYNFRTSDVLTLLKTGLCGIDPSDADLFEDYVYTWSISGNKFLEDIWSMNPDGYTKDEPSGRSLEILLAANRVRSAVIPPLVRLRTKFSSAKGNTLENCRAIYDYLGEIGIESSLSALAEFDVATGNLRGAGESLRIYDSIVTSLSSIAQILSDTPTTSEELLSAIEIMLRGSDMGSVPAVGEYVTVGSAPTLRVENLKLAIVSGLCEGEFPKSFSESGIFTEQDKATMEELDISLTSRESRVTSDELFYVYRALTKPSEKLIVTTCSSKVGGGTATPSTAWNRIFFLFPKLEKKIFDLELIKKIAEALEEAPDESHDVESIETIIRESAEKETDEPCEDGVTISPLQVRMLFADNILRLSQSKISTFASCPYQYWCKYVLELRERKVSAISYDSSGTVVHYVLEKLIHDLGGSDGSLSHPDDETLIKLVNSYVESYVGSIGCPLSPSIMYTFSRLRDLALVMAKSVLDEFSASDFKVLEQEMRISEHRENALKPIEIKITDDHDSPKIILSGVIDRIDYFDGEDRRYIRVVDYKTGSHPFDLEGLESGNDIQLPAYLFTAALKENKTVVGGEKEIFPASALFLSANESAGKISPERSGFFLDNIDVLKAASNELDKNILAGIVVDKGTGEITKGNAVSEDGIREIDVSLRSTIQNTGKSIFEGRAPRTPSPSACKFCYLRSSCPVAAKSTNY